MKKRLKHILAALALALALTAGVLWAMTRALNEHPPRYQGHPLEYWLNQARTQDAGASNHACLVIQATVVPQLIDTLLHDHTDSAFKRELAARLSALPGVQVYCSTAAGRRTAAAERLGEIGPPAGAAIPALLQVLEGADRPSRPSAALALGRIQREPQTVIPRLAALLGDSQDGVPEMAATALGLWGSRAKAAVPKLLPLLKAPDRELQAAAATALKQICPEAAQSAGLR
ncbi:MAG TPA: HEAT repeat domain-containing protein [Candidatus Acidoferrum sp.]|nr:HEAT repeat domain-containing protein [Candidatus Acidoferrum sp.]